MTEVEKLYELARIEKIELDYPDNYEPFYPEFTAKKQIELIKWLCQNTYRNYLLFRYKFSNNFWQIECNMVDSNKELLFSNALASIIINLWQDLTKEEQEQIKEILK